MSRVYQKPPTSTTRRTPATQPRTPHPSISTAGRTPATQPRPPPPSISTAGRTPATQPRPPPPSTSTARGARAPIRGQTMRTQLPRDDNVDNRTDQQERTVHVGDGYHMFTPSTTKREQIRRQAEIEQRQYEEHIERTRLHNIREVNRLGGDELSEEEVRRRQAEKYRREKFTRLEKTHQDQIQKKHEEEKQIEAKKQAARLQSMENEKRDRNVQLHSMRSTVNENDQGATGWSDEAREEDRRKTMDQFLNRLTINTSSNENEKTTHSNLSKSEKLSILHDTFPHIDDQTLEYYLEIYNGDINTIVHELLN